MPGEEHFIEYNGKQRRWMTKLKVLQEMKIGCATLYHTCFVLLKKTKERNLYSKIWNIILFTEALLMSHYVFTQQLKRRLAFNFVTMLRILQKLYQSADVDKKVDLNETNEAMVARA